MTGKALCCYCKGWINFSTDASRCKHRKGSKTLYFHNWCWHKVYPYHPVTELTDILNNGDAALLVDLLHEHLTPAARADLIRYYNELKAAEHEVKSKKPE
jgi:hypothetical protein